MVGSIGNDIIVQKKIHKALTESPTNGSNNNKTARKRDSYKSPVTSVLTHEEPCQKALHEPRLEVGNEY